MCNSLNHPPGCNCGFGPRNGNNGTRSSQNSSGMNVEYSPGCFMTNCYWCEDVVHFVRARNGGCFLADSTNPWIVHPCWAENKPAQQFVAGYLSSRVIKDSSVANIPLSSYLLRKHGGKTKTSTKSKNEKHREFIIGEQVIVRCKPMLILDTTTEYTMVLCCGLKGAFHGKKFIAVVPFYELNNLIIHYKLTTISGLVSSDYYWGDKPFTFIETTKIYARKPTQNMKMIELDETLTIEFDDPHAANKAIQPTAYGVG